MKNNEVKELSDIEHLLLRGSYVLGSFSYIEREQPMLGPAGLERTSIRYVPALLKIACEIIDNAVDEAVRSEFKFGTHIRISMNESSLEVKDDGRGIPVKPVEGGDASNLNRYQPAVAFTQARAGTNFDDCDRTTIGMNGLGAFAANVFSATFKVTTCDGAKTMKVACHDNCGEVKLSTISGGTRGTTVYLEPDFSRFEEKPLMKR
jgi:DNA gyrase/topoisomerase IV subunit B